MVNRIEICGGIASGKTTLAEALAEKPVSASLEAFQENPFWSAFYADPFDNAFEAEVSFLLQHYHQIKSVARSLDPIVVCDYSLLLDRAYAATTLTADELQAFLSVYNQVTKRIRSPILVVHLRCDPHEELARIARRGRKIERTATLDLLARLNAAIDRQVAAADLEVSVLQVDSDRLDFTELGADRQKVVADVREAVGRATGSA